MLTADASESISQMTLSTLQMAGRRRLRWASASSSTTSRQVHSSRAAFAACSSFQLLISVVRGHSRCGAWLCTNNRIPKGGRCGRGQLLMCRLRSPATMNQELMENGLGCFDIPALTHASADLQPQFSRMRQDWDCAAFVSKPGCASMIIASMPAGDFCLIREPADAAHGSVLTAAFPTQADVAEDCCSYADSADLQTLALHLKMAIPC